jgi:hypothetical protein
MVRSDYVIENNLFLSDEREMSKDEMPVFGKNTRRNRNSETKKFLRLVLASKRHLEISFSSYLA